MKNRKVLLLFSMSALYVLAICPGVSAGETKTWGKPTWIDPTNVATIDEDVTYSSLTAQPAADQIKATSAHQTATGAGVVVAILDGGWNLGNPMISGNLHRGAFDAIDGDGDPEDPGNGVDDDWDGITDNARGHGNFVAGMVLMAAPDATILPIRVVDDEGYGLECHVYMGVQYAMQQGADVINLSLELVDPCSALENLLVQAAEAGIVVVCSAGNAGETDLNGFGDMGYMVAVGSVDDNDVVSEFSNRPNGNPTCFFMFAPGEDLWGPYGYPEDNTVAFWSGTSFSAGIVSGAAALIIDKNPDKYYKWWAYYLEGSVDPVYDEGGNLFPNGGRINLETVVSR